LCERSERKIIKPQRLEKILIAATKQSLKSRIPVLHPMVKLPQFLKHIQGNQQDQKLQKFIAHCEDDTEKEQLKHAYNTNEKVLILIGPEGDFTPNEIQKTNTAGFSEISLGNSRLRTETAGLVACHTIHLAHQ
jgi:16S rRNA (uracil1498-N3)-methyltransferase